MKTTHRINRGLGIFLVLAAVTAGGLFAGARAVLAADEQLAAAMPTDPRWSGLVAAGMKQVIDLNFVKARLNDVFRVVAQSTDVNIVVDPAVQDQLVDVHLKSVPVADALAVILDMHGLDAKVLGNSIFVSSRERIKSMAALNKTIHLKNASASDVEGLVTKLVASVSANTKLNALVISGSPEQLAEAEKVIAEVDAPQRQVLLVTRILEMNSSAAKEIGIDWSDSTTFNFQETRRDTDTTGENRIDVASGMLKVFRLARDPLKIEMIIKHLVSQNKGKILSNPKLTAIVGKESSIFIGDRVPYEITTTTGGVANTEVRFAEAGVRLFLMPSIIEKDYVVVTVKPEVSNIVAWKGTDGKYPQVRSREAQASVRVADGETFVLGGLLSDEEITDEEEVPFLSKIPVMGGLFKYKSHRKENKEIIITITPNIIK